MPSRDNKETNGGDYEGREGREERWTPQGFAFFAPFVVSSFVKDGMSRASRMGWISD